MSQSPSLTLQHPLAAPAAQSFTNPVGVLVPRARFLPVKSTSDLFLVQSNLFSVLHGRCVRLGSRTLACSHVVVSLAVPTYPTLPTLPPPSIHPNEDREFPANVPLVKFGPEFQRVDDYERRFRGEVDVRELDHLTVSGDVVFGEGVALRVRARARRVPFYLSITADCCGPWGTGHGHYCGERGVPH